MAKFYVRAVYEYAGEVEADSEADAIEFFEDNADEYFYRTMFIGATEEEED
jgi:hypothetical protein